MTGNPQHYFVPTSERHVALFGMPSIGSQLPLVFANGGKIRRLNFSCVRCRETLPGENVRGNVSFPTDKTAVIDAVGICHECKIVTPFFIRAHDDMRFSGLRDGQWVTWTEREPVIERLARFIKNAMGLKE
jgi:hypothetical protein